MTAVLLVLAVWKLLVVAGVTADYKLPDPSAVWHSLRGLWLDGTLLGIVWTSVSRGLLGFLAALAIGTPLGLLVARSAFVRAAIGPILSGLQSLPSVAWVPAAVIWLGITDSAMYAVILLGAVPSIANGLVSGIDQVPPLYLRARPHDGRDGRTGSLARPAARRAARLHRRAQAGLGLLLALADGGGTHRLLPRPGAGTRPVPGERPHRLRHAGGAAWHPPDPVRRHRHRPDRLQPAGAPRAAQPGGLAAAR
ncbi:hypothetical protein GCM10020000_17490 [Streptomyces olivoverticillatus]